MPTKRQRDLLQFEKALLSSGHLRVAGVDEVGRGCLAGPVFAASVVLPAGLHLPEVDDSKKLSSCKREQLFEQILSVAVTWSVASVGPKEIDRINIHQASLIAMERAVEGLNPQPDFVLVDGRFGWRTPIPLRPVVHGDSLSQAIAAASIIAKVSRDRWMIEVAKKYPGFGFERHKGYGTVVHLEALRKNGPVLIHRRSFGPVARLTSLSGPLSPRLTRPL